eukprot:403351910
MNNIKGFFAKNNQVDPGATNKAQQNQQQKVNTQGSLVLDNNIKIAQKNAIQNSSNVKPSIQANVQNMKQPAQQKQQTDKYGVDGFTSATQNILLNQTGNTNNTSINNSPGQPLKQGMKASASQGEISNYNTNPSTVRSGGTGVISNNGSQGDLRVANQINKKQNQNEDNPGDDEYLNDEFLKRIFRPTETKFKNMDPNSEAFNFLDPDLLIKGDIDQFVDRDGRTILHRAALEQRYEVIRQTIENLKSQNIDSRDLKQKVNRQDKYGNTPLQLSCVYDHQDRVNQQSEVVQYLIGSQADVDTQNPHSRFTPLHWACIYGRTRVVSNLLEYDAKQYIPDKYGFFPIDYAGKFKHVECVKLLVDNLLRKIQENKFISKDELNKYADELQKPGPYANTHDNKLLMFNPIFHTSTLYWSCMLSDNEMPPEKINEIMDCLEAYPELPVLADRWRTPCHAAAQSGSFEKLNRLLRDVKDRYDPKDKTKVRTYRKMNVADYKPRFQCILRQNRYIPLRKFYILQFEKRLWQYSQMQHFKYDFQDKFNNTPLHIASQYGHEKCVQILIEVYLCSVTLRNSEGWMAKDLQQHDKVYETFQKYYRKRDTLLQQKIDDKKRQDQALKKQQNQQLGPGASPMNNFQNVGQLKSLDMSQTSDVQEAYKLSLDQPTQSMIDQDRIDGTLPQTLTSEKDRVDKELIQCRNHLPMVPPFILRVSTEKENSKAIINGMIVVLQNQGFTVQMFPAIKQKEFFIALRLKQSRLEQEAKSMKLKIKLCDIELKQEFEPHQKVKFEPFRTKDQQKIIMSLLKNILSPESLMEQEILIQILPMHDFYGIHEIKEKWESKSKSLGMISQFYKEGIKYEYIELSSIKNYFGEKTGFYFAWMSFYTSWILIPAILGFILTIYQIIFTVDNIFTSLYSLLVCIWVTIFIERWRRKSSEIALRWGVLEDNSDFEREVRPDFNGDEYFSNINQKVNKLNVHSRFYLIQVLSIPIFIILIGACVGVYFATRTFKNDNLNGDANHDRFIQTAAGIINGVAIAIVNFIYQLLATIFMKLENHKYADTYEKSFIFKLFAFKFINTNISLFYTAFIDQNFNSLYYLIIGMALQKCVQIFAFKIIKKYITFWYKRRQYFKSIKAKALEQSLKHKNFMQELDPATKEQFQSEITKWQSKSLYQSTFNGGVTTDNVYYRLVFNTWGKIGSDLILVDYIEQNSVMIDLIEKEQINEISEVFILFGLATLYACACPIVGFIVMIHNLIDIRWDLWTLYTCIRRPIAQCRENIGPWLQLAEFMAIVAVISNCLLLYFSSPTLKSWLTETFEVESEIYLLWIIIALEHFIILVKVICSVTINDMPGWVQKSFTRVKTVQDKIMIEENERDENEKIDKLKKEYSTLIIKYNTILSKIKQNELNKQIELQKKDKRYNDLSRDKERSIKEEKSRGLQIMKQIEDEKNKFKPADKLGIVDFLGIQEQEWFGKQRIELLEQTLNRNLQQRLMNQTFNKLERDILGRRISKLYSTKKVNQINCSQCSQAIATLECLNCQDHFCSTCSSDIHNQANHILSMHTLIPVPLEPSSKFTLFKPSEQVELAMQNIPKGLQSKPIWKKFEYFNFTLDPANDLYQFIQRHYVYLRSQYIDCNYIEPQDKIGYQALFVNKQYDLLTESQAKVLQAKHKKLFGDQQALPQNDRFNEEELLYMNRTAFYLFRYKGDNLTFANFAARLSILQHAQYNRRVSLWLSIMDEKGEDLISREYFEQFLQTIYIQDITQQMSVKSIVDLIFSGSENNQNPGKQNTTQNSVSLNKVQSSQNNLSNGKQVALSSGQIPIIQQVQEMNINKLIEKLNVQNEPIRSFMECVLQFNESEVKEKV